MFRGLTQRAQRLLTIFAQEEAKRFHSDQLLPEHVILAVLKEGRGVGIQALRRGKVDAEGLQVELERNIPKKQSGYILGNVPPSQRGKKFLENSAAEAKSLGHEYIGTEHMILAAAVEQGSIVARYLEKHSISVEELRELILEIKGSEVPRGRMSEDLTPKRRVQQKRNATPTLDEFTRDITHYARANKLDPVIGRTNEIERVIQILSRRNKNNPVLIGEPGVGKTAIVEGLAQKIVLGTAPEVLTGKRVLTLDLAALVAGTKYRGEFEARLKRVMKEIMAAENIILFIDELHTIIGAGGAEGAIDASNMLKPALSRGELQCVGATTLNEYRKYIEKDAALERRFQPIFVEEPTVDDTVAILNGIKEMYEAYHNVCYTKDALETAARLGQRYIIDRFLPDKAIDLIDEAGSTKRIKNTVQPKEVTALNEEVDRLTEQKIALVSSQNYEKAAAVRDDIEQIKNRIAEKKRGWKEGLKGKREEVTAEDIQMTISRITGIPLVRIAQTELERLLNIEEELHETVVGQDDAITAIASAIRRSRIGLSSPRRPMGSFIFLGPTGVGKSLLAKSLAEFLFGDGDALVRIDMSDFMEKHNVSRLIGAPPGYVGYEEGGGLTEKIRRRPYSVILLDEIEKAHTDVFNILLQVLEEGELQDNLGHKISFRNTVLIMTSNVGAREISREAQLGFKNIEGVMDHREIKSSAMGELKRKFPPEFINRVDEIVVFHILDKRQLGRIFDILMGEVSLRLLEMNIFLHISKNAREFLLDKGYDTKYGARPLRRVIQKEIEDPLSQEILKGNVTAGDQLNLELKFGQIKFRVKKVKTESAEVRD